MFRALRNISGYEKISAHTEKISRNSIQHFFEFHFRLEVTADFVSPNITMEASPNQHLLTLHL